MRLFEITKKEFLDEIKSPELAQTKKWERKLEAELSGNWKVEVTSLPIDFYADYYIDIISLDDFTPTETDLIEVVKIASDIIPVWAFHQYHYGYKNNLVNVDVQLDIASGREGLFKGYSDEEIEKSKFKYNWEDYI